MAAPLQLKVTDYLDSSRWRWLLEDSRGTFLADHNVFLNPTQRHAQGFANLQSYLNFHQPIATPAAQLAELGRWIGQQVFGGLLPALRGQRGPATPVHLVIPPAAQELVTRPFELARFADDTPFAAAGIRFVYQVASAPPPVAPAETPLEALRILAVFSLPVRANPLNLRRERYQLQRLVRDLATTQRRAIQLRVLQYGATRDALRDALEDAEGWDIIHLSGHGRQGELLLEDDQGGEDTIDAAELGELLELAQQRLKLLLLDACYSGASSHAAARRQVGLDPPTRDQGPPGEAQVEVGESAEAATPTVLPNLAVELSERLDCAALAMRYPVDDTFATDLLLSLYEKLLDRRQPLPAALGLALGDVGAAEQAHLPLAVATPILVGARAATLRLAPPQAPPAAPALPTVGLPIGFPPEPAHFVGRLQPMLRASQALAPRSMQRGVLFYGMPGAGKTACALELAYRHEQGRFDGYVWHQAPLEGSDVSTALFKLCQDIQTQLNAPKLGLTATLSDPAEFRQYTLPRLRALLQESALLLVLDNLESLLTPRSEWRISLWGDVIGALLSHNGLSRVVLTSRRLPTGLARHPALQVEPIHALSFAESVLLARELPHLGRLFGDAEGRGLLQQTLRVVQGHPKLLELADGLAKESRAALEARVRAAGATQAGREEVLEQFLAKGGAREGESRQDEGAFLAALREWTASVAGRLGSTARLLFTVLCCVEPDDRREVVLKANWADILTRLGEGHAAAAAALAEGEAGLASALASLEESGLIDVSRPALDPDQLAKMAADMAGRGVTGQDGAPVTVAMLQGYLTAEGTSYRVHPGVAEAARLAASPEEVAVVDVELGSYHGALVRRGLKTEQEGGGNLVTASARKAVPYLFRQARWDEASSMLSGLTLRDTSPETLAFALPFLRRIAVATTGSERELTDKGILATTLQYAGQVEEAEQLLREVLAHSVRQGNYWVASVVAGELTNLLRSTGRLEEALKQVEEMAEYTRLTGLGPWSQLSDEGQRLQLLAIMGQNDQVLAEVARLRPQLASLSLSSNARESVNPWNVREAILNIGCRAAIFSNRWALALDYSAEIIKSLHARNAPRLEVARKRFNDYSPLLELGRHQEAQALLMECRAVFEAEGGMLELGKVYAALGELENELGNNENAVRFEEVALGYKYQANDPDACASSHNKLSNYLERQGSNLVRSLAHQLAGAILWLHIRSGHLPTALHNLARTGQPDNPPAFADVAAQVETIPGVRFRELYRRLPGATPDGEASVATIWQLVAQLQHEQTGRRQRQEATLAALPPAVRAAFDQEGDAFGPALRAALAALPEAERAAIRQQLYDAELLRRPAGHEIQETLNEFEPLLQELAAAVSDTNPREELEARLAGLEEKGWMLRGPVLRIWVGERDAEALTMGLDDRDAALVRRLLELLETQDKGPGMT